MVDIRILKHRQKAFYKNIVSVSCPILNNTIYFSSKGFNHLLYKSNGKPRNIDEQYMKLMCLSHAPDVIRFCTVISETRKITKKVKGKIKTGFHYELVHEVLPGKKIRVIVEKIGTGKHQFLSVMPHKKSPNKKHP